MHVYSRSQVDIAKNAHLGIPQLFCTHFGTHCTFAGGKARATHSRKFE